MSQALTYLYEIYTKFLDLVFNQFELFQNVTIGWIVVVLIIMSLLINSILNIPKLSPTMKGKKNG